MINTQFQKQLRERVREAAIVEPNDLGIPLFTSYYRKVNKYFKRIPFIFVIPLSFLLAISLCFLFGVLVIKLVSLLQYGF